MNSNGQPGHEPESITEKAAGNPYQENATAQQETEEAILSVPVKDYSDYEIAIESKDHFEDALFGSEDELEQALTENQQKAEEPTATDVDKPKSESAAADASTSLVDFSIFQRREQPSNSPNLTSNEQQQLKIIDNGINQSPARKTIPLGEAAQLFEQQLQHIEKQLEAEKHQAEQTHTSTPPQPPEAETTGGFAAFTQKLKTKSRELSKKGLAKMEQSRAELEEYLGRSLPERTIPLDFILPIVKDEQKELITHLTKTGIEKLFAARGKSLASMLEIADRDLSALSHAPLTASKRISYLNAFAPLLSEKILAFIAMFERKPCHVDDEKRTRMADHAMSALKHLIVGYKQVYAEHYQSSNLVYGPQRKQINQIAFQLLDLLYLEQLLATSLHLGTISHGSKIVNKLFYVLSLYEPEVIHQPNNSLSFGEDCSAQQLFIGYHLLDQLAKNNISSTLHKSLKHYLNTHRELVKLIPFQISQRLTPCQPGQQLWMIRHSQESLQFSHHKATLEPDSDNLYFQIQPFFNQVKQDYVRCLKSRMQGKPHPIKTLPELSDDQCLTLLSSLNQNIKAIESGKTAPAYSFFQPIKLKAYSGLRAITAYCIHDYIDLTKAPNTKQAIEDLPDRPVPSKSQWACAHQDDFLFYLQTTEHKLGIPIDIGQLFLLAVTEDKENMSDNLATDAQQNGHIESRSERPSLFLTRVTSMERGPEGKLQISANILSTQITSADCAINQQRVSSNLLGLHNDQRLLFTDHKDNFYN